jgi:hypothetical protein
MNNIKNIKVIFNEETNLYKIIIGEKSFELNRNDSVNLQKTLTKKLKETPPLFST